MMLYLNFSKVQKTGAKFTIITEKLHQQTSSRSCSCSRSSTKHLPEEEGRFPSKRVTCVLFYGVFKKFFVIIEPFI